jgi:hypothetical protein
MGNALLEKLSKVLTAIAASADNYTISEAGSAMRRFLQIHSPLAEGEESQLAICVAAVKERNWATLATLRDGSPFPTVRLAATNGLAAIGKE